MGISKLTPFELAEPLLPEIDPQVRPAERRLGGDEYILDRDGIFEAFEISLVFCNRRVACTARFRGIVDDVGEGFGEMVGEIIGNLPADRDELCVGGCTQVELV